MNIRKLTGYLVLFFTLAACANTPEDANSLLWKISGNGLESSSYLFGTHHLIHLSFLDSIHGLDEAFDATAQTVGELDMGKMDEMQMKIASESIMPEDHGYHTLLSEADRQLLDKHLKGLIGVGLEALGRMKPAMLSNLITVSLYRKYYPRLSIEKSIDQYFQEEALTRSRPVVGLESVEDQICVLLNSQPLERQAEMLICTVKHPELLKKQMDDLQTAYRLQDMQKLREIYEKEIPDDPCPATREEKDLLNKGRNEKWLEKLPGIMQDKPSFIAVGCFHLPGKDGLIEGLRRLGYKVEPVMR